MIFILLNPSDSDFARCDPTISKCIKIAKEYGYECIEILNLLSIIEAVPDKLPEKVSELTEVENKKWIKKIIKSAEVGDKKVVCTWGDKGFRYNANHEIFKLLEEFEIRPYCLGTISYNQPGHPERKAISKLKLTPYDYSTF